MRPKKKRTGHEQPDLINEEISDSLGGTELPVMGEDEDWGRPVSGETVGYDRPLEQDVEEAKP